MQSSGRFGTPPVQTDVSPVYLLADQNTAVSHLSLAEGLHGILDTAGSQRECHGGRGNLLLGSKLDQRTKAVARGNQGALDTDTLDVKSQKGDWGGRKIDGKRVDRSVNVHQGHETM